MKPEWTICKCLDQVFNTVSILDEFYSVLLDSIFLFNKGGLCCIYFAIYSGGVNDINVQFGHMSKLDICTIGKLGVYPNWIYIQLVCMSKLDTCPIPHFKFSELLDICPTWTNMQVGYMSNLDIHATCLLDICPNWTLMSFPPPVLYRHCH